MNNKELSNKVIPAVPRDIDPIYLLANPKGNNTSNTPNMAELKNLPKLRTPNLVLVKQTLSRPPQKLCKPVRSVPLPSSIRDVL